MIDDAEIQKLKKQYPEFFTQFPKELWEFIFSEETVFEIVEICLKSGVEDEEKIEKIASRIILALLNQVPRENLPEILEKGVNLNREVAERVSLEVNRRIFSQASEVLKKESQPLQPPPASPKIEPSPEIQPEEKPKEVKKDIYREPIE